MWSYKILFIDVAIAITICIIMIVVTFLLSYCFITPGIAKKGVYIGELKKTAKTGDVVLFSSKDSGLRFASFSKWSHMGVIIRDKNQSNLIYLLESDSGMDYKPKGLLDHFTNEIDKPGVRLVLLEDKIKSYNGYSYFLPIKLDESKADKSSRYFQYKDQISDLLEYMKEKYSTFAYQSKASYWTKQYDKMRKLNPLGYIGGKKPDKNKAIVSSDLVTEIFQHLGIVRQKLKPSNVFPKHYSKDSWYTIFNKGWSLGKDQLILLDP